MRTRKIKEKLIERWIELYKQGISTAEIAKRSGVSPSFVYKHLDKADVIKRRNTNITLKMVKEWIELYKTGNVNCCSIARKYNVSRQTVFKYLHLYGIKTSRKVFHNVEV